MHIAEKTVLITGASRGVGEALVKEALNRAAKRVFAGTRGALPKTDPRVTALKRALMELSHGVRHFIQRGTTKLRHLLRAAAYCVGPGARNPCQGTGGVPAILIFTSTDQGRTWKYFSTPVRASVNTAGGLWEPEFEIAQDQSLVMFWSDETHSCCKGQQLRQIRTIDGVSWRDETTTVTGPDGARPGMAIVRQNPITHRFFMTYEYCGVNRGCSAYYRWSDDGWNFGNPDNPGTLIRTAQGDVFQHAPANVWSPARGSLAGEIIVVGQTVAGPDSPVLNGQVLFVNDRADASGPWRTIPAPVQVPAANGNPSMRQLFFCASPASRWGIHSGTRWCFPGNGSLLHLFGGGSA